MWLLGRADSTTHSLAGDRDKQGINIYHLAWAPGLVSGFGRDHCTIRATPPGGALMEPGETQQGCKIVPSGVPGQEHGWVQPPSGLSEPWRGPGLLAMADCFLYHCSQILETSVIGTPWVLMDHILLRG